mmetsp:Transcript_52697/g.140048  ORF Transcript_52697/g.140048 Transcript_52697/m.140048 type:complete len:201 (+) Transcript_52697:221-823(+)
MRRAGRCSLEEKLLKIHVLQLIHIRRPRLRAGFLQHLVRPVPKGLPQAVAVEELTSEPVEDQKRRVAVACLVVLALIQGRGQELGVPQARVPGVAYLIQHSVHLRPRDPESPQHLPQVPLRNEPRAIPIQKQKQSLPTAELIVRQPQGHHLPRRLAQRGEVGGVEGDQPLQGGHLGALEEVGPEVGRGPLVDPLGRPGVV